MNKWQLHEAKNKLSNLIDQAVQGQPQCITRRGQDAVVLMSIKEYQKLKRPSKTLGEFLLTMPKSDEVVIKRFNSKMREIDL
ncbi:MAG: type II toxin-antitoxin system Phd/YefM family antitoxin [Candidatus Tisiphia sp.]